MYRVAIVGRPNVGKSTFFNRLTRSRKALVGDEPGITRDRIFQLVRTNGKEFEVIDTGGIVPGDGDLIPEKVLEQAEVAIEEADLVFLVVDARSGLTPLDREVAVLLQSRGKEFMLIVNKVDSDKQIPETYQFFELGVEKVFPISAEHNLGIFDVYEEIEGRLPDIEESAEALDALRVAIVGRPNVGKSSLVNRLLGQERVIVSDIPGTTRDSVDTLFSYQGRHYRLIDTAGIRRKGKTDLMAEKLSVIKAREHMEHADVAILVVDAVEGATKLDATIAGYAYDAGCSLVVVVNKWDLIAKDTYTAIELEQTYRDRMRFLDFAPMSFISAKSGQRVFRLFQEVDKAAESRRIKIPTGEFNQFLEREISPFLVSGGGERKPPIKYGCQVSSTPPTFVLFLRGTKPLHFSKVRYLSNRLRERWVFYATPIKIIQRTAGKWSDRKK